MKRKLLIVGLILLAILTISASSAAEDANALEVDDASVDQIVAASADDVEVEQIDDNAEADPVISASADDEDVVGVDDSADDIEIAEANGISDVLKEDKYDEFHIKFAEEVSVKDTEATVVSFDWPDWVPKMAGVVTIKLIGTTDYIQFGKFDNTHVDVTLRELGITSTGTYSILFAYGDDEYSKVGTLKVSEKVSKPKITGKDITMLYTSNANYKVHVTIDGKAVAGQYVTFKFNGHTKTVKTNNKGYATYKIPKVAPKKAKYTITATYKGTKISNKVKVNGIVVAKNVNVKKSNKVTKVKVTLKKVNKKYLSGKKLTLKFKGKKYKATTNKKGVAIFKLKKNIFQKLKVGKKYKYTVTYGKDTASKSFKIKK